MLVFSKTNYLKKGWNKTTQKATVRHYIRL